MCLICMQHTKQPSGNSPAAFRGDKANQVLFSCQESTHSFLDFFSFVVNLGKLISFKFCHNKIDLKKNKENEN